MRIPALTLFWKGGGQNPQKRHSQQKPQRPEQEQGSIADDLLEKGNPHPEERTLQAYNQLQELVSSFTADLQAPGISANIEGAGLTLKIALRDASGGLIRQWTAQEFLRLRAQPRSKNGPCGKILDQKL